MPETTMRPGRAASALGSGAAFSTGLACLAVDIWTNVDFIAGVDGSYWSSSVAAVVVVAIATAVALSAAGASTRRGHLGIAAGLFAGFLCGAAFSLSATLDRVASARDAAVQRARAANAPLHEARQALTETRTARDAECATGRGPKCRSLEAKVDELRRELGGLGAERVEDSMGVRIAAMIPGLTPEQVQLYQPVFLPVALFLFANFLIAFGLAGLAPPNRRETPPKIIDAQVVEIDPVVAVLQEQRGPVSNRKLARIMGWSEATTSRRVEALAREGKVSKTRDGRAIAIRLT